MTIGVGYLLKGRKPCLYYYPKGNEIVKLATFISEREAKEFLEVLKQGLTEVRVDTRLESWELNYKEIEEAIREIKPIAQLKVVLRGEE